MKRRYLPIFSALALALTAGAARAGSLPACGEQPYFEDSVMPATLTRAEVAATAVTTPPAVGEMSGRPTPATARWAPNDRATVVAELRAAISHGYRVASGEAC